MTAIAETGHLPNAAADASSPECVGAIGSTLPLQPMSRADTIARLLPRLTEVGQVLREVL
jgi:hypothetical protein